MQIYAIREPEKRGQTREEMDRDKLRWAGQRKKWTLPHPVDTKIRAEYNKQGE
jgi:hypothetical protein